MLAYIHLEPMKGKENIADMAYLSSDTSGNRVCYMDRITWIAKNIRMHSQD